MNKEISILAFGASSSRKSINKKFAGFAAGRIQNSKVKLLDLNDFEMPIYSIDKENKNGFPELAINFKQHIKDCDAIIISFAEHNGAYTAAFKNIFDWISRIEKDVWANKPMLLLSTSDGARGASTVLELATTKFKRMNKNSIFSFSLPSFNINFKDDKGIVDVELAHRFDDILDLFSKAL
jgi:chromate reductase